MNRKEFFNAAAIFSGAMVIPDLDKLSIPGLSDPIKKEYVKEFVGASHSDFNKVKEMLDEYPNLIYSSWDWGKGDFEMCIGAAGHTGHKEIANLLLERGARINLFVLTMLGKSELVIPILEAYPNFLHVSGPHGFTLLHHAKVGGKEASPIFDYIKDKGLKDYKMKLL